MFSLVFRLLICLIERMCPLYNILRDTMRTSIPDGRMTTQVLLHGDRDYDRETNRQIQQALQKFLIDSGRFKRI